MSVPEAGTNNLGQTTSLIGKAPAFLHALQLLKRAAQFDATVLLEGETGTGKELAARSIHYNSTRRDQPFIPINCGALPDDLVVNELFGHERGAFTDARGEYPGALRLANHGTLFLDEVDSLNTVGQVSLLRFLQDQRFRPLGSRREHTLDVRIIAASNCSLESLCARGGFRADLYYRLKLVRLCLPPLRDRPGDAQLLAEHFLSQCAKRYGLRTLRLDDCTLKWLDTHPWPGNVRELENLVHSAVLLAEDGRITLTMLQPPAAASRAPVSDEPSRDDVVPPYAAAKVRARERFDRDYLCAVLEKAHGNITRAAALAGQERRAIGKLVKKYSIDTARYRD
jgi:DNA-binding NtrC family response regulator